MSLLLLLLLMLHLLLLVHLMPPACVPKATMAKATFAAVAGSKFMLPVSIWSVLNELGIAGSMFRDGRSFASFRAIKLPLGGATENAQLIAGAPIQH